MQIFPLYAWWAVMLLGMVIGAAGVHNGSYLSYTSQKKIVFRKPFALRIGAALFGIGMVEVPIALSINEKSWLPFISLIAPCVAVAGLFLRVSGPDELQLDLAERTYRRISGWPIFFTTWSGPWTNLWGIYVGVFGSTTGSSYFVGLRGTNLGGRMDVGRFGAQSAAEQFADELASDLGLPRVSPPKPLVSTK